MDHQITALTKQWFELVGRDHHKDRDCHFYVEKRWSYGEPPVYVVQHQGYVWDEPIDETFPTYTAAARLLVEKLREMVAAEREWSESG